MNIHRKRTTEECLDDLCENLRAEEARAAARDFRVDTYVIVAPEARRVKIGSSARPHQRLRELQTGSPVRLDLLEITVEIPERVFHEDPRLRAHHSHGEWYFLQDGFVAVFDTIVAERSPDCNFYDLNFNCEI